MQLREEPKIPSESTDGKQSFWYWEWEVEWGWRQKYRIKKKRCLIHCKNLYLVPVVPVTLAFGFSAQTEARASGLTVKWNKGLGLPSLFSSAYERFALSILLSIMFSGIPCSFRYPVLSQTDVFSPCRWLPSCPPGSLTQFQHMPKSEQQLQDIILYFKIKYQDFLVALGL